MDLMENIFLTIVVILSAMFLFALAFVTKIVIFIILFPIILYFIIKTYRELEN